MQIKLPSVLSFLQLEVLSIKEGKLENFTDFQLFKFCKTVAIKTVFSAFWLSGWIQQGYLITKTKQNTTSMVFCEFAYILTKTSFECL